MEIAIFDALMPTLVPVFLLTGIMMLFLDKYFSKRGIYLKIWYPALFRFALFACIFCGLGLIIY
jgi:mannose/fructose/N-acetylgalactosamine-specific phosphotransferase system component IID